MKNNEIIKELTDYNAWRRGGDGKQICPTKLGLVIDGAISLIGQQQNAIDSQIQIINALKLRLEGLNIKYGIDGCTTGLEGKFKRGDRVRKKGVKGQWHGVICGEYSASATKQGYAVESEREQGSVQIYPESALEFYSGEIVPSAADVEASDE